MGPGDPGIVIKSGLFVASQHFKEFKSHVHSDPDPYFILVFESRLPQDFTKTCIHVKDQCTVYVRLYYKKELMAVLHMHNAH